MFGRELRLLVPGSCQPSCLQKKLTTLDIAANRIKRIENIGHLTELQEFWVCSTGPVDVFHLEHHTC